MKWPQNVDDSAKNVFSSLSKIGKNFFKELQTDHSSLIHSSQLIEIGGNILRACLFRGCVHVLAVRAWLSSTLAAPAQVNRL